MKKITTPTVFIVLGATGDLMAKKIVPALFHLYEEGHLPEKFTLLGVSRRDWADQDFRSHVSSILDVKVPDANSDKVAGFLAMAAYHKIVFENKDDYVAMNDVLRKIDETWGAPSDKLFYLSVPPQFYSEILENLHASGLTDTDGLPDSSWKRVIVEKPFGNDEKSARALDAQLADLFSEDQIYRIDHYLAKEMLQNIIAFRFANNLFEGEWDASFVEEIHIRMYETIGVEDRGAFYDAVGTLRDVGQNHLLAMLALVTMERPLGKDAKAIRAARANLLKQLEIPTIREAASRSIRAQYDGYRGIKGVASDSKTETYFRAKGFLTGRRWEGVPFTIESGKALPDDVNEIEIILRHPTPCWCKEGSHMKNRILITIEPHEGITVKFMSKKPGYDLELEERTIDFKFRAEGSAPRSQYTEEYEKLILDCIVGDQTLFVSSEETLAMWRFIDPFISAWDKTLVPMKHYAQHNDAIIAEADVADATAKQHPISPREIGIYGLGKMGANVARQLKEKGWRVVASNRSHDPIDTIQSEGIEGAYSLKELAEKLRGPRIIWLMITAGKGVDEAIAEILPHLKRGDTIIDAGNSQYDEAKRRAKVIAKRDVKFIDVGFSGGPSGARSGGSLMVGGDAKAFERLEPLFRDLSVPQGYRYFGDAGSGHFVKMVHNGIEYGMMQSIAEGFALMQKSPYKLDLESVARLYNHGSVIESKLVAWLEDAYRVYGRDLKAVSGSVNYTGEGEWTVQAGKKMKLAMPAIEESFKFRVKSQESPSYTGRILSALRNQFGGHSIETKKKPKK